MREVHELIERVADTDVTVLVRGESGTGKELVARAIHDASPRQRRTFVKVNCAALPAELLESELFGFERGAFTGAIQHKPGKFEFANHGTMFLDEISEMSAAAAGQAAAGAAGRRVRAARRARRTSASTSASLPRPIATSNRAVADGHFREDLFFRLNVVCITLPPLRQRRDDIPALTDQFLQQYAEHYNRPTPALATDTLRLFAEYDWPGNVRELENLIKRMVVLGTDAQIRREVADAIAGRALRIEPDPRAATAAGAAPDATGRGPARGASPAPAVASGPTAAAGPAGSLKDIARHRRARSRARVDLAHAAADAMEPARGRRNPGHQLQGVALQNQGS